MKSLFYIVWVNVIFTLWDSTVGSQSVRCDQLHKETGYPADFIRITSFTVIYTMNPIYNCSKAIFIRPISPHLGFTIIVVRGNGVMSRDTKVVNCGKTGESTDCGTGNKLDWKLYRSKLESDTNGYFCAFACDDDGLYLTHLVCDSAGNSRNPDIESAVAYLKKNVLGADAIFDATENCPAPKCAFFP